MIKLDGVLKSELHEIRIKFTKGSDNARVYIRKYEKGRTIKRDIELPKEIKPFLKDFNWRRYYGQDIITYVRKNKGDNYIYTNKTNHIIASTSLGQRLEELVYIAFGIK